MGPLSRYRLDLTLPTSDGGGVYLRVGVPYCVNDFFWGERGKSEYSWVVIVAEFARLVKMSHKAPLLCWIISHKTSQACAGLSVLV